MFLEHGTDDLIIDHHQSVYMYEKVKAVCGEDRVRLELFEGEPHGSQKIKSDDNIRRCIDFIDEVLYDGSNPYRKEFRDIRIVGEE